MSIQGIYRIKLDKIRYKRNTGFAFKNSLFYITIISRAYKIVLFIYQNVIIQVLRNRVIIIEGFQMGCEHSHNLDLSDQKFLPTAKKKADIVIGCCQETCRNIVPENVQIAEQKISVKDHQNIYKIIKSHFFFSNFSKNVKKQLVKAFAVCNCKLGEYIFHKGDPGSLFFIIREGNVVIEIDGKIVLRLSKNGSFGQLSLLYGAPRSASVKAQSWCSFWCLDQRSFHQFSQRLAAENYNIAYPLLKKSSIFHHLTKKQLNNLSYEINYQKYQPADVVFTCGARANSFYMIVEGSVKIEVPGQNQLQLIAGDYFGENCFKQDQVRLDTATASEKGATLISIGRQILIKFLGDGLNDLINLDVLKRALMRSNLFKHISNDFLSKVNEIAEIREYQDNEIIIKKGQKVKFFMVCLEGKINGTESGVLLNQQYFQDHNSDNDFMCNKNIKKQGTGNVYLISISKFEQILNLDLKEATKTRQNLFFDNPHNSKQVDAVLKIIIEENTATKHITLDDLNIVGKIGQGDFSHVFLVKNLHNNHQYALKCMKKKEIKKMGIVHLVKNQKNITPQVRHPLIVKFIKSFKDDTFIYFLKNYIDGTDFDYILRQKRVFNSDESRFYLACIISCIEQLHNRSIIYRNLTPENAIVDSEGYLQLLGMGITKKINENEGGRTFTVIGTAHYMAPEIIEAKGYGLQADIWSLGVLFYEMVCGQVPFGAQLEDPYAIYQFIADNKEVKFPKDLKDKKAKKLINRLLRFNPAKRSIDFQALKNNQFFQCLNWEDLAQKKIKPPSIPHQKKSFSDSPGLPVQIFLKDQILDNKIPKGQSDWDECF